METESHSHSNTGGQGPLSLESEPKKPAGGWRAVKYILGNESFEKLASMSLVSNITLYLRTKYNMNGILLVNVVTIWFGSSNLLSIAGAIVSDAYLGRFLTLLIGTICALLGMGCMTLTASIPQLRPQECNEQSLCTEPHKLQLGFLFAALGLIAIGAGCIRPCNIAFGADQFDTTTEKGRSQLESFFNWWYLLFTVALLIALTGVVYIQTNISWAIGFAIPTACFVVSVTIFLIGQHTYIYKRIQGSVFIDMAKVIAASFRKRKIKLGSDDNQHSFYDPVQEQDPEIPKPMKVKRFNCLDKAAVITDPGELDAQGTPTNSWKLCSVQQVQQLKCLVGIIPVWFSGIGCFLVMDQLSTFGVLQAIQMNRSVGNHFKIPPAWMTISSMIALSIWIYVYEGIYIPTAKKILKRRSSLTLQQRIGIGIVMSILCMVVAGVVEKRRREQAIKQGSFTSPVHILVLIPQFFLAGLTEAFAAVAIMEFVTVQMPESMRSIAGSIFFLSLSIASYLSSLIVNVIHSITGRNGKLPWLGGHDLNKNRLDYYYYIIATLGAINLIYFTFFSSNYVPSSKAIKVSEESQLENSVNQSEARDVPSNEMMQDEERGLDSKTI
ncbi:Protein NRT1/PTR FAMILY 2.8 [Forsythia ovata]|uniref:Protein NRT1/PTR FAMILY 2.8 n=1 Tax=Forsythia ovata TaxID=205694 RepID=A0ABD1R0Q1_9LAMI